jgi:solute carrier family 25 thiamine pyrophosphate transporter 19
LSGAFAGFGATAATYPFDLMRTRFAMQGNDKVYTSLAGAFASVVKSEGFSGLYRGLGASLLQIMPNMGIMFESYRLGKKVMAKTGLPKGTQEFLAGGSAGIISKLCVMPFDTVRKRLQVQFADRNKLAVHDIPRYQGGFLSTATQIIRHEGVSGLYKGTVPALLKSAPSSAVIFFVVERCREFFTRYNEKHGTGVSVD